MPTLRLPPHREESAPWAFRKTLRGIVSYRAAVPSSIAEIDFVTPPAYADASRELAARIADLEARAVPAFASLEPFLVRTEAVASSRIEDEITTVDQFARAEAGRRASPTARTVHGAARAVLRLIAAGGEGSISERDVLAAHGALMGGDPSESMHAGSFREVQNWIGGPGAHPVGADYVPPVPGRVLELTADLFEFMARDDVDPLAQTAIAHAQFESIHPFVDGNGRIGRALINAQLRRRGMTRRLSVPVAAVLSAERDRYFSALIDYRSGAVSPILDVISDAIGEAVEQSGESMDRLAEYPEAWLQQLRPRAGSAVSKVLPMLPDHPIFDVDDIEAIAGVSESAAYRAIETLEGAGVVRRLVSSKRDGLWGASVILDEADHLIARIANRHHGLPVQRSR
ncbi:MAG: Fic family protein [Leucobacter sp.]